MMNELLRFKKNQKYLVIDAESESLMLRNNRPWELSYVLANIDHTIDKKEIFIYFSDLNVSEDAARITGFDKNYFQKTGSKNKTYKIRDRVVKTVSPNEAYNTLCQLIDDEDTIVVYHNGIGFDNYLWASLCYASGNSPKWDFLKRTIDTNALVKAYKKGVKSWDMRDPSLNFKWNNFWERGLKSGLSTACKDFGVDYDKNQHHSGLYDVEKLTLGLLKKIIWKIDIGNLC